MFARIARIAGNAPQEGDDPWYLVAEQAADQRTGAGADPGGAGRYPGEAVVVPPEVYRWAASSPALPCSGPVQLDDTPDGVVGFKDQQVYVCRFFAPRGNGDQTQGQRSEVACAALRAARDRVCLMSRLLLEPRQLHVVVRTRYPGTPARLPELVQYAGVRIHDEAAHGLGVTSIPGQRDPVKTTLLRQGDRRDQVIGGVFDFACLLVHGICPFYSHGRRQPH